MKKPRVLIVGNPRETHVGRHLVNGATVAGIEAAIIDLTEAYAAPRILRSIFWHLLGRRPVHLNRFSQKVVAYCAAQRPDLVLTTGIAPLNAESMKKLHDRKVPTASFLTDDPWNQHHHTPWFMRALPRYDHVFTPRRANQPDLAALSGPLCHYLPFAYAPEVHFPPELSPEESLSSRSEVLFIGGGDEDRATVMRPLQAAGLKLSLWGGYWERIPGLAQFAHGHAGPEAFRKLTASAAINLCLVRRANRDGHSMRSFELPAVGGCMLVEDTEEHRMIFGANDECVRYFRTTEELVPRAKQLLADPGSQQRLAKEVHRRICSEGRHTYADRLAEILRTTRETTDFDG